MAVIFNAVSLTSRSGHTRRVLKITNNLVSAGKKAMYEM